MVRENNFSFRRLPRSLTLLVAAFCAVIVLSFAVFSAVLAWSLVQRARSDVRSMASAFEQYALRTLEVAQLVAEQAREELRERGGPDALPRDRAAFESIRILAGKLPAGSAIIVVDEKGKVVLRTDEFPATPLEMSDRGWFRAMVDERQDQLVGEAILSRVTRRKIFVLAIALRDAGGSFRGAINIGMPSDAVIGENALPSYGKGVALTAMLEDGRLIARNVFPEALLGQRLAPPSKRPQGRGDPHIVNRAGDGRLAIEATNAIPRFGVIVSASVPMRRVLAPLGVFLAVALPGLALVLGGAVFAWRGLRDQQAALAAETARLESVLDTAQLGSWHWNVTTGTVDFNERWAQMLGHSLAEIEPHVRAWEERVHPDDRERVLATLHAHLNGRTPLYHCEHRLRHKDGHWVWVVDNGRVVQRAPDGRPLVVTGTHFDITESKLAEERMKLVMFEVDHRAKNMLAIVQAVVNLMRVDTVEAFRVGLRGRITALARAHTLLADNRWRSVAMGQLVREEIAPFQSRGTEQVTVSGPQLNLDAAASQGFAMALHELASNAARHGALTVPEGRVSVLWSRPEGPDGPVEIVWTERGGPSPGPPARLGFGSAVIRQTLERQLNGSVAMDWRTEGLVCTMRIDARHLLPGENQLGEETPAPVSGARPAPPSEAPAPATRHRAPG